MSLLREVVRFSAPVKEVRLKRDFRPTLNEEDVAVRLRESYAKGWEDGCRTLNGQIAEQRQELQLIQRQILGALSGAMGEVIGQCEEALMELVSQNVRKIVGEIPISEEMIRGVVREALQNIKEEGQITLRMHPEDLQFLEPLGDVLPDDLSKDRVQFAPDTEISRGDCLVQSRFGTIDARRATKLKNMEKALSW